MTPPPPPPPPPPLLFQKSSYSFLTKTHPIFFLLLINLSILPSSAYVTTISSSSSSKIPYSDHCNSIVPESPPTHYTNYSTFNYLQFRDGYYIGGEEIINPIPNLQFTRKFPKSLNFYVNDAQETHNPNILKLNGVLTFRNPNRYRIWTRNVSSGVLKNRKRKRRPRFPIRNALRFFLQGFWSKVSGKVCMVGSGTGYSKEGNLIDLSVVFKLNYPQISNITTSFVSGTLESVSETHSLNHFEPISLVAFAQLNYNYTFILSEPKSVFLNGGHGNKGLGFNPSAGDDQGINSDVCSILQRSGFVFGLEYESGCNDAKNCSPIAGADEFLPDSMSFSGIQCSEMGKLRMLIGFYNSTFTVFDQPLAPDRMLIGEGVWDRENNQLDLVVCRIMNVAGSLVDASVGDCSVRLSLWFPATLSLRTRSTAMGNIWSNKTMDDSGYFSRIRFESSSSNELRVPGMKYEYTEISRVSKTCAEKKNGGDNGKTYPGVNSRNLMFDMRVGNDFLAWGYGRPLTVGDQFYQSFDDLPRWVSAGNMIGNESIVWESTGKVSADQSLLMNISYMINFVPPTHTKLTGQLSLANISQIQIVAEGIYNTGTGGLCMVGCRYLGSDYKKSIRNRSMDCEILINAQFADLNTKSKNYVKGSIKSTRGTTDPLYFGHLEFASLSVSENDALESVWRLDLEITMVLIANTLICVFVGSQLFYVKKHPDMLPSISLLMLVILTLGHMIPLVLNFEALFLNNHNRQNVLVGSGGWLEVNEVIVRVVTMVAFLLQFYLLQLTWSSKLGEGSQNDVWLAEKKAFYVFLPLCLVGGLIAWFIHWLIHPYETPNNNGFIIIHEHGGHSLWGDLRSYAGLLLDGFLLPQILLNVFWNSKDKALSPAFYFGTTAVRLLPHAYDLYRAHRFAIPYFDDQESIYANPRGDFFSTAWDIIIPCAALLFAFIIYFQQRFGGSCMLPSRFKTSIEYEKVPVATGSVELM